MIDHIGFGVSNYATAKKFYTEVLKELGYELIMEIAPPIHTGHVGGFGPKGQPAFWISEEPDHIARVHIAFTAPSRDAVDGFYKKAMELGAKDNGAPGLRPEYSENYYGAFVIDEDGHNVEAVCRTA